MTRAELESVLNCRIVLSDVSQLDAVQGARVVCRLFYALGQPSDKFALCVVGDEDLSGYEVPTDEQVDAIYTAVMPQLIASGIALGDLTRARYGHVDTDTKKITEVYLVDGEYVNDGTIYDADNCFPWIKSLAPTAIVGGEILGD